MKVEIEYEYSSGFDNPFWAKITLEDGSYYFRCGKSFEEARARAIEFAEKRKLIPCPMDIPNPETVEV